MLSNVAAVGRRGKHKHQAGASLGRTLLVLGFYCQPSGTGCCLVLEGAQHGTQRFSPRPQPKGCLSCYLRSPLHFMRYCQHTAAHLNESSVEVHGRFLNLILMSVGASPRGLSSAVPSARQMPPRGPAPCLVAAAPPLPARCPPYAAVARLELPVALSAPPSPPASRLCLASLEHFPLL